MVNDGSDIIDCRVYNVGQIPFKNNDLVKVG